MQSTKSTEGRWSYNDTSYVTHKTRRLKICVNREKPSPQETELYTLALEQQ